MINNNEIKKAIKGFCDNAIWKEYYDTAPSEVSKKHAEMQFAVSYHCVELSDEIMDEFAAELHKLEDSYSLQDWQFEYKWSGRNPHKTKCGNKICELVPNIRPNTNEGIFDEKTGEKVKSDLNGYFVTFHQNESLENPYGGYSDDDYADMCAITVHELNAKNVYIGSYDGYAVASFVCNDKKKSYMFAIQHNQHSIYDLKRDIVLINLFYDKSTNPMRGI